MTADRQAFTPNELAVVLSHYDLGVIESAKDFLRGSRKSPKLLLQTARGSFLLKRRAEGRDDPYKVAFAHALLGHARRRGLPVPKLIGTRDENNSMLQLDQMIYELFEFVKGEPFDGSLTKTTGAGKTLAAYHAAVADFETEWTPPTGSFHDSDGIRNGLNSIPTTTGAHDSVLGHEAELLGTTQELFERYDEAVEAVDARGFGDWPSSIIHGDWHPGNMLFRGEKVAVVLDFDAARMQPPVIDVANGLLQFSILRGSGAPEEWPAYFDETRMRRFHLGYADRGELPEPQRAAIPELMIESLIAETVLPIAATGSFGWMPGFGVLQMVRRKVRWLRENLERLRGWLLE